MANKTINKIYRDLLHINNAAGAIHKHGADSVDVTYGRKYTHDTLNSLNKLLKEKEIQNEHHLQYFKAYLRKCTIKIYVK